MMANGISMAAWKRDCMKKYGFYIHFVLSENTEYVDCHTHGLMKSFHHPELQFVIPIDEKTAASVLNALAEKISAGRTFHDGEYVDQIIDGFPVLLLLQKDQDGTQFFRIIFPDPNGLFPDDEKCMAFYVKQKTLSIDPDMDTPPDEIDNVISL
jgi:hypothetical protein